MKTPLTTGSALLAILLLSATVAHGQSAQQPPSLTRTDLVRQDLRVPGQEIVQVHVGLAPGYTAPMHTHPGEEVAYVLKGELEYRLAGKPPVTLKEGEALFIPAGTPHSAKNVGKGEAYELATYVVEKGKPLFVVQK